MNKKNCGMNGIINILSDSSYQALLFDNIPNQAMGLVGFTQESNKLIFMASTIAYSVRGLYRECGDEYNPILSGFNQYLGGFIGGILQYNFAGLDNNPNLFENSILGIINNIGYEIIEDFQLDQFDYTIHAAALEVIEPIVSKSIFASQTELYKDIFIKTLSSLIASFNSYYIYDYTQDYLIKTTDMLYNISVGYIGNFTSIAFNGEY